MRCTSIWLGLLICVLAVPAAGQRGEVYCHVTDITAEQLSNGVKVTIEADGELNWDLDFQSLIEEGAVEGEVGEYWVNIWGFTEKFRRLPIVIWNARSKLGSGFVPIEKYPVSHAEIRIPEWAKEGVGIEIDLVNYLGLVAGEGRFERWRGDWWTRTSTDGNSIVVLWESDRFPAPSRPETPKDLSAELDVWHEDGALTVRAVNAKLQDVTQAIARSSGCQVSAPGDDVRVSLYLRDLGPEELLCAIASGCGLCAREVRGGRWVLAEAMGTSAGYGASVSRRVHLKYLRAAEALDLLPNFLLDYVRADEQSNCLVVNGPDYLADRVEEDIGKLDVAAPEIEMEVVAVEFTSGHDLARALQLDWSGEELEIGVDTLTGDLSFLWLEGLPEGWAARLSWLEADTSTHLKMRMTTRMLNGHQGFVAAGEERFVVLERVFDTYKEASLQSISTGSFVSVQPLVGSGEEVLLNLGVVVRSLRGTDPRSGLPIVSLRRANGALRVRDGETVILAGIEAKDWRPGEREIPVLSSTPVVGGVFRAPERSQSETRLAFFVTPRIIRGVDPEEGGDNHHG